MFHRELTPEEDARLLTKAQVDALADGARVMIKWSGGNGPWEYRIGKARTVPGSYALAGAETESRSSMRINWVSAEPRSPLTRVFLPPS